MSALTVLSGSGLWGYLDPGSGSMAFQLVIASVLSGMVFFRGALQSVKNYLSTGSR